MARYKHTDAASGQGLFMSIKLKEQLIPGTFEHMLDRIIGTKVDISAFDRKYKNDLTGASAIPPSALLKLVIYGYSKGCNSSRKLSELNENNIIAKALTSDMRIHWTTIGDFVSQNSKEIKEVFVKALVYCNELGLIGGETYAIDGYRLPSNASTEMSGTEKQLQRRLETYRKMAEKHLLKHRRKDAGKEKTEEEAARIKKRQGRLNRQIENISNFLEKMEKKKGQDGREIKSNVTDNESAMIYSSKGYMQGYIGLAISDKKNQIITSAQAAGSASEGGHLPSMLEGHEENLKQAGLEREGEGNKKTLLGDSNYFSEDNLRACRARRIQAIIPDGNEKKELGPDGSKRYEASDFTYNEEEDYYGCPNGKRLNYKYKTKLSRNREGKRYQAGVLDCRACPVFKQCMRGNKKQNEIKKGRILIITKSNEPGSLCRRMREKMTTPEYQEEYAYRIQIVEPVFANIGYNKGLNRFTLRTQDKVNGQWLLYCLVHNLGKCLKGHNLKMGFA